MYDVVRVTVVESAHDLLEEAPGLVLGHLAAPDNVLEQLSAEVLDDHDDVRRRVYDVVAIVRSCQHAWPSEKESAAHSLMM